MRITASSLRRVVKRLAALARGLGSLGSNVSIGRGSRILNASNVHLGSDVFIGRDCWLFAGRARIEIGSKVMIAPQVALITGDHNISIVGQYMFDVEEKLPDDDLDIVIEDDVWLGFRSVILKGVTVGRGSVVAACPWSRAMCLPIRLLRASPLVVWGLDSALMRCVSTSARWVWWLANLHSGLHSCSPPVPTATLALSVLGVDSPNTDIPLVNPIPDRVWELSRCWLALPSGRSSPMLGQMGCVGWKRTG